MIAGRRGQRRESLRSSACSAMSASLAPAPMHERRPLRSMSMPARSVDAAQADHLVRLGDVFLLQVEQVGAAGQQFGRAPLGVEQADGLLGRRAAGSR